jgi:hypothetical protein
LVGAVVNGHGVSLRVVNVSFLEVRPVTVSAREPWARHMAERIQGFQEAAKVTSDPPSDLLSHDGGTLATVGA